MENTITQKVNRQNAVTVGKSIGKIHNIKQSIKLGFSKPYIIAALEELEVQLNKINL